MCKGQSEPVIQYKPPPSQIKRNYEQRESRNKIEGKMDVSREEVIKAEKVNQPLFLQGLLSLLMENNRRLNQLSNDKTELATFEKNFEEHFSQDISKCLKVNLTEGELQIDTLVQYLLIPFRRSYSFLSQKRYLIFSIQNLLQVLQEIFQNKKQNDEPVTCLNYLKNHFSHLAQRFEKIIVILKEAVHLRKDSESKGKILKSQTKLQEIEIIGSCGNQKLDQNKKENKEKGRLETIIIGLNTQVQKLKNKLTEEQKQINEIRKQLEQLKGINKDYQKQVQNKNKKIAELKVERDKDLNDLNVKTKQTSDKLTEQNRKYLDTITKLNQQIQKLETKIKDQSDTLRDNKTKVQLDDLRNTSQTQKYQSLQKQLNQSHEERAKLEAQNSQLKQLLSRQKQSIETIKHQSQLKIKELERQQNQSNIKLQESLRDLKHSKIFADDIFSISKQKDELLRKNQAQNQEIRRLNVQLIQLQQQIKKIKDREIQQSSQQQKIKVLEQDNKDLRQLNMKLQQKFMKLQQKLIQLQQKSSRMRTPSFVQHVSLFSGEILEKKKQEKRYLIDSIEKHMKKFIQKTKLLYQSAKDEKVDFHSRTDGKENLVLVLQTEKAVIAGYYSGKYAEKIQMTEEGLILSLNNQRSYRLNNFINNPKKNKNDKKQVSGMVYDKFFFIFGNAEIRVKPGEKDPKVFSNFAVSSAYFNSQGDNINILFGQGTKKEVPIISYEIYEVIFAQFQ